jgi:hypothetical protein
MQAAVVVVKHKVLATLAVPVGVVALVVVVITLLVVALLLLILVPVVEELVEMPHQIILAMVDQE